MKIAYNSAFVHMETFTFTFPGTWKPLLCMSIVYIIYLGRRQCSL